LTVSFTTRCLYHNKPQENEFAENIKEDDKHNTRIIVCSRSL